MTTPGSDQAATSYPGPASFQLDPAASAVSIAHKTFWGMGTVRSGTLTVAGQARQLTLSARVTEATGEAITLAADADIDRADFGMRWNQLGMIKGKAHVSVIARFVKTAAAS